jgi:hypothetical protein
MASRPRMLLDRARKAKYNYYFGGLGKNISSIHGKITFHNSVGWRLRDEVEK